MEVDARPLQQRLNKAQKTVSRIARNALNDAARELRAETPAYLQKAIDKPRPFTSKVTAVLYTRADYSQGDRMSSHLRIAPIQAKYLNPAEFGTESEHLIQPIRGGSQDRFGGVGAAYRRTPALKATLLAKKHSLRGGRTIGQFFVGTPLGADKRQAGIWYRSKDLKTIKLVAAFIRRRKYRAQFGISEWWATRGEDLVEKHVKTQSEMAVNRM